MSLLPSSMFTYSNTQFTISRCQKLWQLLLKVTLKHAAFNGIPNTLMSDSSPPTTSKIWRFPEKSEATIFRLRSLRSRTKPLAFIVICASLTLDIFNVTGLTYDQVDIAEHFDIELSLASWSLSAYSLTFGSFLLLAGRAGIQVSILVSQSSELTWIGDMYGHKNIYSFGLLSFSLFSALSAGVSENFIAFCVLRALQGASAACTVPTAYAIIANTYNGKARELAVAGVGLCTTCGAIVGSISKFHP